jgi:hypothetical protein
MPGLTLQARTACAGCCGAVHGGKEHDLRGDPSSVARESCA